MAESDDDLALWGAVPADDVVSLPQMRRIGERLYVRLPDAPRGSAVRLPLRLSPDVMRRALEAGDGVEQVSVVVAEVGDDDAREMWAGLDHIARLAIAAAYFRHINELAGLAAGESSR